MSHDEHRIQPSDEILGATREWLAPVRAGLGPEFLSAYLHGSVLTRGFDPARSQINLLVIARSLDGATLDGLARAIPKTGKRFRFQPLFMSRTGIEKSLDSFPIEWLEIQERHLLVEGEESLRDLEVPRTYLRVQCEHELRGKHLQLRQAYLLSHGDSATLQQLLEASASGFATLFRTLLRLAGETPPADTARVIERVADRFQLDAEGLLLAYLVRSGGRRLSKEETPATFRRFLDQIQRLVIAIDLLPV